MDKSKKSLNITSMPATPPQTLTTTSLIITETASDSKYRDHLEAKLAEEEQQIDKLIKRVNEGKVHANLGQPVGGHFRDCQSTTFSKRKLMDLEAYFQRSCVHVNGLQKDDHENNDNLRKTG